MESFALWLAGGAVAVFGYLMRRGLGMLDSLHVKTDANSERLARIEGKIMNGQLDRIERKGEQTDADLKKLPQEFHDHVEGEEKRIAKAVVEAFQE